MLRNYFKTAWRTLLKSKTVSLINVCGLSIGISAALVIFLLVQYDLGFDKFENENNRIYRVVADYRFAGSPFHSSAITAAMPSAVRNEVAGIEDLISFRIWHDDGKISVPTKETGGQVVFKKQKGIVCVDQAYFKLLSYQWLQGSPQSLRIPYQVVLTESALKQYFPGLSADQAIGREMVFDDSIRMTLSGIVNDLADNTDFSFKTFISKPTIETQRLKPDDGDRWTSASPSSQLFIKLSPKANPAAVQASISKLYERNATQNPGNTISFRLQPLADLHFDSDYENFNNRTAHKMSLYGLGAIAVFLLMLGCLNFINLSTARASQRAKEIGVRKTLGSSKRQLLFQFLSETFLLTLLASLCSMLLAPVILILFAGFIPTGFHVDLIRHPGILLFVVVLVIMVSAAAGLYPAFILSAYKPVTVLRGKSAMGAESGNRLLRKSFITSQFVIAQVFIIATIVVAKQINYSLSQDLGFKKNAVINLQTGFGYQLGLRSLLMDRLKAMPGIRIISLSNNPPTSVSDRSNTIKYVNDKKELETHAQVKFGDSNYLKLYQIKLLAGANITNSDTMRSVLINETGAQALGFRDPERAVGKFVEIDHRTLPIVGVVADFHQKSFHEPITPLVISSKTTDQLMFNILLQPQSSNGHLWKTTIDQIKTAFHEVYPDADFEYAFLDNSIAQYYLSEKSLSQLLMWATGLTIFISCLGLFGLAIHSSFERTKEIGVRKIVGATVWQIVLLLVREFLKPVMVAFLIAAPVAWYGAGTWLQNFAFRTGISFWIFIVTGCSAVLIALLTISVQSIKAATVNPARSLKTEG